MLKTYPTGHSARFTSRQPGRRTVNGAQARRGASGRPLGLRPRQSDFGQDFLRLDHCARRRKETIDDQMREAMNEAPGGHSRRLS